MADILSETKRRLARVERATAAQRWMHDHGMSWVSLEVCLDLIDHIDAAGDESQRAWDEDPGEQFMDDGASARYEEEQWLAEKAMEDDLRAQASLGDESQADYYED